MRPGIIRLDLWVRNQLPFVLTFALLLVALVPSRVPGFTAVVPMLPMMGVFYWAIYRPDLLPPLAAFALGLLFDLAAGTPLGVEALVFLLVQGITASQRRFFVTNTFVVAWWGFSMIAAGATLLEWLLSAMLLAHAPDDGSAIFRYLLTVSLYPLVGWVLARVQVLLLKAA